MRRLPCLVAVIVIILQVSCSGKNQKKLFVLINPLADNSKVITSIKEFASQKKIHFDTISNVQQVSEDTLANYSLLVMANYSIDTLNYMQQADLQRFIEGGGDLVIFSDRKDTILNWPWMSRRLNEFVVNDVSALATRIERGNVPDYSKATTKRVPEENRFVVEVLDTYMYEPMEMVIFNDGRILYVERRGDIKIYDPKTKKSRVVARFDVSITGNYEDGILGVTLDPDFEKNNWIYINYSPATKYGQP